ncbi:MAG: HlyD family efflux transporter periplasmic adaptor subunit [Clostridia bacterium]|nr:HlyD family efflux transporter periplasmic adaptor subunit [Clostridia bacterium]
MPDKEEKTRDFKKIKKRKRIMKYIYLAFLLFLVLYVPGILLASGGAGADIAIIGNGTIIDSIKADGLVVRDDKVFSMPFNGVYLKEASEGERIPAGFRIASIVDETFEVKFRELEALEAEILSRKKDGEISSGIFTKDLLQVEEHIKAGVQDIALMVSKGSLENLQSIINEIENYSDYRDEIISGSTSHDAYTEELERQYEVLEQSLSGKITELFTNEPGYISYWVDGFEDVYNTSNITGFGTDELREAIRQGGDHTSAESDGAFARLSTGNFYTIAFVLREKDAQKLIERGTAKIVIEGLGIEFNTDSIELGEENDGEICVFIKTNSKLNELASVRTVSAEIIFYEYSGLIVPEKCLVNMDAYPIRQVEIAKVQDNWVRFIEVKVIAEGGGNVIIESPDGDLNLFDYYIIRPKRVEEGQVVK